MLLDARRVEHTAVTLFLSFKISQRRMALRIQCNFKCLDRTPCILLTGIHLPSYT